MNALDIEWRDAGLEPREKPNPLYPEGIHIDISVAGYPSCQTSLPYPARRIGGYIVRCKLCGASAGCTTAGRPDDPRSIKIACRPMASA